MPSRWTLTLASRDPGRPERPVTPAQLHGLAATLLEGTDADHHAQHKPHTVSPLLASPHPGTALLRLGWLPDRPRPDLTLLLGQELRLGAQFFTVRDADEEHTPYELLRHAPPAERAILRFRSVTYFSRRGHWYPLPDPGLVYGGLIRRWNLHAPPQALITEEDGKRFLPLLALSAHDIASAPVDLGPSAGRIGFTGTAAFRLVGPATGTDRRLLSALTLYATAAGIGAQTTHGLGTVETELE
ncbi:CRISPR system precrRNA processing endoribonuclease RAMP protein Cas6 [Streptomyces aidingensis]|uniref:CRISPR-associated endoribonuclease Cas6 n=1 Tax=Streptomyces aidingensis TaxID=910347 RepID=A0A1I1NI11_9ACTN|nr:CRISPR system precrRNA processing endoribonuclease RAMP protein Cas6 [Streptomyces aidingensis]SFC97279.1 CRISPR-associated endoribonuclease Cas6 [Streptomyces aidingensis]